MQKTIIRQQIYAYYYMNSCGYLNSLSVNTLVNCYFEKRAPREPIAPKIAQIFHFLSHGLVIDHDQAHKEDCTQDSDISHRPTSKFP